MLELIRWSTCVLVLVVACGGKLESSTSEDTNTGSAPSGGGANGSGSTPPNAGDEAVPSAPTSPRSVGELCENECRRVLKTVCYDHPPNYHYAYTHCMDACPTATDAQRAELQKCTPSYPCDPKCMRVVGWDPDPGH